MGVGDINETGARFMNMERSFWGLILRRKKLQTGCDCLECKLLDIWMKRVCIFGSDRSVFGAEGWVFLLDHKSEV